MLRRKPGREEQARKLNFSSLVMKKGETSILQQRQRSKNNHYVGNYKYLNKLSEILSGQE